MKIFHWYRLCSASCVCVDISQQRRSTWSRKPLAYFLPANRRFDSHVFCGFSPTILYIWGLLCWYYCLLRYMNMEVSWNRDIPTSSILDWDFPLKTIQFGVPTVMETSILISRMVLDCCGSKHITPPVDSCKHAVLGWAPPRGSVTYHINNPYNAIIEVGIFHLQLSAPLTKWNAHPNWPI